MNPNILQTLVFSLLTKLLWPMVAWSHKWTWSKFVTRRRRIIFKCLVLLGYLEFAMLMVLSALLLIAALQHDCVHDVGVLLALLSALYAATSFFTNIISGANCIPGDIIPEKGFKDLQRRP